LPIRNPQRRTANRFELRASDLLRISSLVLRVSAGLLTAGCGSGGSGPSDPANDVVRARVATLAPAKLAHRGMGPTRPLGAFPENSLSAFRAGIDAGADGVELDVELTADGQLLVMHDDTLDRTTMCAGCVNAYTLDEARACILCDGHGRPTDQHPPSLAEVYAALPPTALVNVELKVFGDGCVTPSSDAAALARVAVAEVKRLGAERRTIFSSFEAAAVAAVKAADPQLYAALLIGGLRPGLIDEVAALGLDAVHPFFTGVTSEFIAGARAAGLQVNVWTVNGRDNLRAMLELGVDGIITDEPGVLADLK
jgi:glycerophosphoryl diester phosphodiesterase